MAFIDVAELIIITVGAGCIGAFIALRKDLIVAREDLAKQSSKISELNQAIAKEHNGMAQRLLEVEEKVTHVQNYINSLNMVNPNRR